MPGYGMSRTSPCRMGHCAPCALPGRPCRSILATVYRPRCAPRKSGWRPSPSKPQRCWRARARESFDPLAALAGARHTHEVIWVSNFYCEELLTPLEEKGAEAAAARTLEAKRVRKDAMTASQRDRPAPVAQCHESAAAALRPRLLRWRAALGMSSDEVVREAASTLR